MLLTGDMKDLLMLFQQHRVRYVLVGGFAVNYHGYVRTTQDIDLLHPLSTNWVVHYIRLRTVAACTGTTTADSGFGTLTEKTQFWDVLYDIKAPAADFNIQAVYPQAAPETTLANGWNARITTTGGNVDQLVTGCAVEYAALVSRVP